MIADVVFLMLGVGLIAGRRRIAALLGKSARWSRVGAYRLKPQEEQTLRFVVLLVGVIFVVLALLDFFGEGASK